jgi:tRNA G18 (ribose-2'-O)-methylase SpoU
VICVDLVDAENLGAIIRSAAAIGADAAILSQHCADVLGRRVTRTSMGAVFHLPVAVMRDDDSETSAIKGMGVHLVGATPRAEAVPLSEYAPASGTAVVLGNEGSGLDDRWIDRCRELIRIPMAGATDSLNVSVAAGILLYTIKNRLAG